MWELTVDKLYQEFESVMENTMCYLLGMVPEVRTTETFYLGTMKTKKQPLGG